MDRAAGVLVIGADGLIGGAVATRLESLGIRVVRTSRRGTTGAHPLDLAALPAAWSPPPGIRVAVVCAAVTSTEECRLRPDFCRIVNVDAPLELGRRLHDAGARTVFLSTNMVFDGTMNATPATAPRRPMTVYGRLKADAEEGLLAIGSGTTVVRLTKTIGRTLPVIERWREAIRRGERIRAFHDLVVAPVPLDHAVTVITHAACEPLGAILQVSASADISYADVAVRLARRWGFTDAVDPTSAAASGLFPEHLPGHTTLDTTTIRDRLAIDAPDPWDAFDEVA
ncbi:MAG: SDR family oxidoreductase [Planctomycetaceae bacterium]